MISVGNGRGVHANQSISGLSIGLFLFNLYIIIRFLNDDYSSWNRKEIRFCTLFMFWVSSNSLFFLEVMANSCLLKVFPLNYCIVRPKGRILQFFTSIILDIFHVLSFSKFYTVWAETNYSCCNNLFYYIGIIFNANIFCVRRWVFLTFVQGWPTLEFW